MQVLGQRSRSTGIWCQGWEEEASTSGGGGETVAVEGAGKRAQKRDASLAKRLPRTSVFRCY